MNGEKPLRFKIIDHELAYKGRLAEGPGGEYYLLLIGKEALGFTEDPTEEELQGMFNKYGTRDYFLVSGVAYPVFTSWELGPKSRKMLGLPEPEIMPQP